MTTFKLFGAEITVDDKSISNSCGIFTSTSNPSPSPSPSPTTNHSKPTTMLKLFGSEIVVKPPITAASTACITNKSSYDQILLPNPATILNMAAAAGFNRTGNDGGPAVWRIRKRLRESDVNGLSRLLISSKLMEQEVLPLMEDEMIRKVKDSLGLTVDMVDDDTGIVHQNMVLKLWPSCSSYVINGSWSQFCKSRRLRANDVIALRWDAYHRHFHISLLNRASPPPATNFFNQY